MGTGLAKVRQGVGAWYLEHPQFPRHESPTADVTIQAAIDAMRYSGGGDVEVCADLSGDVALAASLTMRDGVRLRARRDSTTLRATYAGGSADDYANALITVASTVTATATTLSASAYTGATSVTVASGAGLAAGDWLLISGNNGAGTDYWYSDGTDVTLYEVVRIRTIVGTTITLEEPLRQWHASASTVALLSAVDDVVIEGFDLDAGTDNDFAVGIVALRTVGLQLRGISGTGFTRSLVEIRAGSSDWLVEELRGRGNNNALLTTHSAHAGRVRGVSNASSGARYNAAAGVPRHLVCFRERSTDILATDLTLRRCVGGVRIWGGRNITVRGIQVTDVANTGGVYEAGVTAGEYTSGSPWGLGLDTGAADLDIAEFGLGIHVDGLTVAGTDGYTPGGSTNGQISVGCYWHDVRQSTLANVSINAGGTWDGDTGGILVSDVKSEIRGVVVTGAAYGFMTQNPEHDVVVYDYRYDGRQANAGGTNTGIAFWLNHHGTTANRLIFVNAKNDPDYGGCVRTGGSFTATAAAGVRWINSTINGRAWSRLRLAKVNTATLNTLDAGALTYTTELEIGPSAGGEQGLAIVASGATTDAGTVGSYVVIAELPQAEAWANGQGTVTAGDAVIASATARKLETDNTPAQPQLVMGRARNTTTNGVIHLGDG